jgi:amino-acid N-acetyltransferase
MTKEIGEIRNALPKDFQDILQLLDMNKLPTFGVQQHLRHFLVWEDMAESRIEGCIGFEVYGKDALLRSLSVHPQYQGKGVGSHLLNSIITQAKKKNIKRLFLLTTTADKFFETHHFIRINRDDASDSVKESMEFQSLCPSTAICMTKDLDT